MMTRTEIVDKLARERTVEKMVAGIAHQDLTYDLRDLCQMVYLVLLEYDEAKILDLYEHDELRFFLARVIITQLRSSYSPYYMTIRRFGERSDEIGTMDWTEDE